MTELTSEDWHLDREPYEIIDNELVGQQYRLLESGSDADGEYLLAEIRYGPGGGYFPEHVHPTQEKTLQVLSGEFDVTLAGEEQILVEGDELTIPPGRPHLYRNTGDVEARILWEFRPPMATDALFRMLSELATEGKTRSDGTPKPLAMAVFLAANPDMVYLTMLPAYIQKRLFKLLAPIGRFVGYSADYRPDDHPADE